MTTVYRVEVRYPETTIWLTPRDRGQWIVPRSGPRAVKSTLASGRAALTRYRNGAARIAAPSRPEYRLVELSGEWTPTA